MPFLSDIISKYIEVKPSGRNKYVAVCPFHSDHDPSLKINNQKGIWKCFACGAGGNANSFIYQYHKLKGVKYRSESISVSKPNPKDSIDEYKPIMPVLSYMEQPSFRHINLGTPTHTWLYTNEMGMPMFYVCRFTQKNGKKEILPYIYASNGKNARWMWKGLKGNRPLYKLHRVVKNDTICIVEGEKAADAGNNYSKQYSFTTFQGGSNAYMLSDYTPLYGKNIVIIDDNDDAGHKCMDGIESLIIGRVNSLKRVKSLQGFPEKWDIADTKWKEGELDQFIKNNAK